MAELGVGPDVLLGVGVGEYAAAAVAGLFSLQDGMRLLARRSQSKQAFVAFAATLDFQPARWRLVNSLTGSFVAPGQALEAVHWLRQAQEPARLAEMAATLAKADCPIVLEMGEASRPLSAQAWPGEKAPAFVPALGTGEGEAVTSGLLRTLARLYVAGLTPDFQAFDAPWPRRKLALPAYPFQRQRHWFAAGEGLQRGQQAMPGARIDLASGETVIHREVSSQSLPFLVDHHIYETMVLPGVHFLAMVLQECGLGSELADVTLQEPVLLPSGARRELEILFSPVNAERERTFRISSRPSGGDSWAMHCQGKVRESRTAGSEETFALPAWKARQASQDGGELYNALWALGLQLGPAFRSIRTIWRAGQEALAELVLPGNPARPAEAALISTPVLDACCQVIASIALETSDSLFLPTHYDRFRLFARVPERFYCHARSRPDASASSDLLAFDLTFVDLDGKVLGDLLGFQLRRAPRAALLRALHADANRAAQAPLCWRVEWTAAERLPPAGTTAVEAAWLVGGNRVGAEVLATKLRERGHAVTLLAEARSGAEDEVAALHRVMQEQGAPSFTGVAIVVEAASLLCRRCRWRRPKGPFGCFWSWSGAGPTRRNRCVTGSGS